MAPISIRTVLISESVDPRCRAILQENGIRVTEKQNMKKDELIAEIKVKLALRVAQVLSLSVGFFFSLRNMLIFWSANSFLNIKSY